MLTLCLAFVELLLAFWVGLVIGVTIIELILASLIGAGITIGIAIGRNEERKRIERAKVIETETIIKFINSAEQIRDMPIPVPISMPKEE